MKTKVLQNKEEKRQALLAAAFKLFTKKDISEVSIAEIAKEAGVAKGTFYLYFKDKTDLRNFLISMESQKLFDKARRELEETGITDFEDSILFLIAMVIQQLESSPWLLTFIRHNLSMGVFSSYISESFEKDTHSMLSLFENRARKAGYHYKCPEAILFMIVELAGTTCFSTMIENRPIPFSEFKPSLFEAIRAILAQGRPQNRN